MSTPSISSPSAHYLNADYLSTLDFLALAGLDGEPGLPSPQAHPDGATQHLPAPAQPLAHAHHAHAHSQPHPHLPHLAAAVELQAGPSSAGGYVSAHGTPSEPVSPPGSVEPAAAATSGSGRPRGRPPKRGRASAAAKAANGSGSAAIGNGEHGMHRAMDVDGPVGGDGDGAGAQVAGPIDIGVDGFDLSYVSGGFDPSGLLRQQLEQIHMQSPFMDGSHPSQDLAQMFLASPVIAPGLSASDNGEAKAWRPVGAVGVLTPGPSGELGPDLRMDMMSPVQLERLMRGDLEGINNPPGSAYPSPLVQPTYGAGPPPPSGNTVIEQLQLQQRQFQEQLSMLQQQQRQLEAAAAAVAASSSSHAPSPYMATHTMTPGIQSAGSIGEPSPGYFSPLASPALEASAGRRRSLALGSPALHGQMPRPGPPHPHPLSALSSPALNPVGSSGGANQTLSPALAPVSAADLADLADPDFLAAFHGALDGQPPFQPSTTPAMPPSHAHVEQFYGPAHPVPPHAQAQPQHAMHAPPHHAPPGGSPAIAPASGPHRNSLPAKTRPSPMMKPTAHRAHGRHASGSVPPSPLAFRPLGSAAMTPASNALAPASNGALAPATVDQRGYLQHQQQLAGASSTASTASTPSPVDLCAIMPPPPVPASQMARSLVPMTPASLMNMGGDGSHGGAPRAAPHVLAPAAVHRQAAPPARAATGAKRAAGAAAAAPKKGSRLVPAGGAAAAKRALAIRPAGVGVRSATKGAAAAAAAATAAAAAAAAGIEPEARKTSHKAAEQKRRDSLKAGFDELRLLLPPINTEALDPESGEPIPGSSAPRLLPKSSLVPDDNPNRGVSKVALLKFSNEYIARLHGKVEKRDAYIDLLRDEIRRLRGLGEPDAADVEVCGEDGEDLLEMDMLEGEEDDLGDDDEDEDDGGESGAGAHADGYDAGMDLDDRRPAPAPAKNGVGRSPALGPTAARRPSLSSRNSSSATVMPKRRGS